MARKPILTKYTAGESHLRFKDIVGHLGMGVDPREDLLLGIPIDGVRGADRPHELRNTRSSYYEKSFTEARSTAGLMLDLGLKDLVADVRRQHPPMPDVEVALADGTSIFIEQTTVMDQQAHLLSLAIEEANFQVVQAKKHDAALAHVLDTGAYIIRFDRLSDVLVGKAVAADALAAEVCALGRTLSSSILLEMPDSAQFPILHGLEARYSYKARSISGSVMQPPTDHGRLAELFPALCDRLRSKAQKRANYPHACTPLWLILDVDHHFAVDREELAAAARHAITAEGPIAFDIVALQLMRLKPIVLELGSKHPLGQP